LAWAFIPETAVFIVPKMLIGNLRFI